MIIISRVPTRAGVKWKPCSHKLRRASGRMRFATTPQKNLALDITGHLKDMLRTLTDLREF